MKINFTRTISNFIVPTKAWFIVFVSTLLIGICIGWIGDILKGDSLDKLISCWTPERWISIGVSVLLLYFSARLLHKTGLGLLPIRILGTASNVESRKVLIIFLSKDDAAASQVALEQADSTQSTREDKLRAMDAMCDNVKVRLSWQHQLRGIREHISTLEEIHILGSKSFVNRSGSHDQAVQAEKWFKQFLPDSIRWNLHKVPVDFENLDLTQAGGILHELLEVYKGKLHSRYLDSDIIIDVTGGQKTTSIGAAMYTLRHPGLWFQYVSTDTPSEGARHELKVFNIVTTTS